jgi:hypothetical protein
VLFVSCLMFLLNYKFTRRQAHQGLLIMSRKIYSFHVFRSAYYADIKTFNTLPSSLKIISGKKEKDT